MADHKHDHGSPDDYDAHVHAHDDHGHGGADSHAGHSHAPKDFGFAFALGTALNLGIVILEATFGILSNSMALLADAGHNLSDVFGLLMAWGASALVKRTHGTSRPWQTGSFCWWRAVPSRGRPSSGSGTPNRSRA